MNSIHACTSNGESPTAAETGQTSPTPGAPPPWVGRLEDTLEHMLEHILEHMLEHLLEHMLEHMLEHLLEHLLEHMLEHRLEHMLEHMFWSVEVLESAALAAPRSACISLSIWISLSVLPFLPEEGPVGV